MAKAAGVEDVDVRWRLVEDPSFDNQIGTLTFNGRHAAVKLERATPDGPESLETSLLLADGVAEVEIVPTGDAEAPERLTFSQHFVCPTCGTYAKRHVLDV